jgi:ribonuclease E
MPSLERIGISRRIADPEARDRTRASFESLAPPPGMGFIVRTAGADRAPEDLRREMEALHKVFLGLGERARREEGPCILLREGSLLLRTLRDFLASEVDEVVVNTLAGLEEARTFLAEAAPPWADRLRFHAGPAPLFHARGVETAVDRMFERRVPLPGGAFLLIEPTEALVSIDVNSGKATKGEDQEETAYATDMKAVEEIGRQLRLRDLGGIIVVDFIDLRDEAHRAALDAAVRQHFQDDRARVRVTPVSEFGIVEVTRRRSGPSHRQVLHAGCPACRGRGVVRTPSSAGVRAVREARARRAAGEGGAVLRASPEVASWLRERKGAELVALGVAVREDADLPPGSFEVA